MDPLLHRAAIISVICTRCYNNADTGDRLATIDRGRKVEAAVPLSVRELGPHLTQCDQGRGVPPY